MVQALGGVVAIVWNGERGLGRASCKGGKMRRRDRCVGGTRGWKGGGARERERKIGGGELHFASRLNQDHPKNWKKLVGKI